MKHCFTKRCTTCKIQNSFHCASQCRIHLFSVFNASSTEPSHEEKDEKSCEKPEILFFISCAGSKLKANHREADFYQHTLQPSNCVTRPFSKPRCLQFKVSAVQRKSDSIFAWWRQNAIRPKSSWFTATPL